MSDISDEELELIWVCDELGSPAEMNRWSTLEVLQKVQALGKPIDELTVGELRACIAATDRTSPQEFIRNE